MAEAVFKNLVIEAGLQHDIEVDSAGTGSWHVGEKAHAGTRRILANHGIDYQGEARQLRNGDLNDATTYVIAMDESNLDSIRRSFGRYPRLYRLLDFAKNSDLRDVPDPYYNGNFELVYSLVLDGCRGLLEEIRKREGI